MTVSEAQKGLNPPPFFKRWRSIYLIIIGNLVLLITLFYLFSRAYS